MNSWAARGNTQGFLALLSRRRRRGQGKVLYLFVDRARWHRGPQVKQYLAAHREIYLEYLPPYQPGLNPQERVWRQLRYERTNNHWFADLDQAWRAIRETTRRWPTQEIRRLCNIS
jgi:transposase